MKRLLFTIITAAIIIAAQPIASHAIQNCSPTGADMVFKDFENVFIIKDTTVSVCHVEIEQHNFILLPDGYILLAKDLIPELIEPFEGGIEEVRLLEFFLKNHGIIRYDRAVPNAIAIYVAIPETDVPEPVREYPFWIAFDRNQNGCIEYGELWRNRSPDPDHPRYEIVAPDSSCRDQEFSIPPFMRY